MYKFSMIFGIALMMAALAILGHDCQSWLERGTWSSTTIGGVIEFVQLNDGLMDGLRRIGPVHSLLELPFYWVSIGIGFAAFAFGSLLDEGRG